MGRGSCASGPRSMMAGASLYRWRTTDQELARNSSSRYSIHYLLRNRAVWVWVCPSAGRSLRPMLLAHTAMSTRASRREHPDDFSLVPGSQSSARDRGDIIRHRLALVQRANRLKMMSLDESA